METFYNGLNGATPGMVDASTGGTLLAKTFNEAHEILERISTNSCQWLDVRGTNKKVIHDITLEGFYKKGHIISAFFEKFVEPYLT
ncbi:MAG: hypothetical protein Q8835_03650, partial [Sweet potato little leaf phytoplasma]|nr:hypothetical protein [Sweet potato little leaf phytoplasma]